MAGYRLVLALYCCSWIIYSIISDNTWKWLIFLTDWTFLCVTNYFIWSTVISVVYWAHTQCNVKNHGSGECQLPDEPRRISSREQSSGSHYTTPRQSASDSNEGLLEEQHYDTIEDNDLIHATDDQGTIAQSDVSRHAGHLNTLAHDVGQMWYHKVSWMLYIISANNSLVVTVVYWTLLYTGFQVREADVAFHLLNSVFMLTETCLSSIPVQLVHVVYAMLYGVLYLLFSVVYWLLGGTNDSGDKFIYPILNYESEPYAAVVLAVLYGLVGLPLAQLINFGFFRLRCYLRTLRGS